VGVPAIKPATVDDVLSTLTRTIVQLDEVRKAKKAEADRHSLDAAIAVQRSNDAEDESVRAAAVHEKLSKLVA